MLLRKTKALEKDTDRLLNKILKIGLVFNEAISDYFNKNTESFAHHVKASNDLETEIDQIRKDIERNLYSEMLIPESRGDVLGLLEALDDVADCVEKVILEFDIEKPEVPDFIIPDMLKVAELSRKAIEELIHAVSAFFTNLEQTGTFIQEVKFYENEIDRLEKGMKRKVFNNNGIKDLAVKLQLRYFIEQMADISDFAEDVCERLAISVIKRCI